MLDPTGERVKNARLKCGMKQEDAALAMNMSRPTLSAIEAGKRMVYAYEIPKFAALYHVTVNELIYGEEWCRQHDRLESYERTFSRLQERDQRRVLDIMHGMEKGHEL
ncbi:MAG: helix-turn-helix transcriptional regulator [Bilifractor sp.]